VPQLGRTTRPRTAVPEAEAGVSCAGAEGKVLEAGAEAALLVAECCHLVGEFLDLLRECGDGRLTDASERRLRCGRRSPLRRSHLRGAVGSCCTTMPLPIPLW
jgi:hypothetical protein